MEKIKTYSTNRLFASVLTVLSIALIFTIDIDRLIRFYQDIELTVLIVAAGLIMPAIAFFGFSVQLFQDRITYRSTFFLRKASKISDLSHVLYQPTWRGVSSRANTARSLHIVRHSGGWGQTISLANGVFREEDLADIARRLQRMNPRIEFDEHAKALIKKY